MGLQGALHHLLARCLLHHIHRNGMGLTALALHGCHCLAVFVVVATRNHYGRTGSGQPLGHTQANAPIATGDDGHLAAQVKQRIHVGHRLKLVRRWQAILRGHEVSQHGHVFLGVPLRFHAGE